MGVGADEKPDTAAGFGSQLQPARGVRIETAKGGDDGGDGAATQRLFAGPQCVDVPLRPDDEQAIQRDAQGFGGRGVEIAVGIEVKNGPAPPGL